MRTTRQKHKGRAKTQEQRAARRAKRARGLEERVLLNIANGFEAGWNSSLSNARISAAVKSCVDKGWLYLVAKDLGGLTEQGREAAGLVLREVPLPKHLSDILEKAPRP